MVNFAFPVDIDSATCIFKSIAFITLYAAQIMYVLTWMLCSPYVEILRFTHIYTITQETKWRESKYVEDLFYKSKYIYSFLCYIFPVL